MPTSWRAQTRTTRTTSRHPEARIRNSGAPARELEGLMHMRRTSIPLLAALCLALAGGTAAAASDDARLAALKQRLATMAEQTARVEAVTQLQRIGRAFGYYSDKGFFGEAADLFTDNATFQWGNDGI